MRRRRSVGYDGRRHREQATGSSMGSCGDASGSAKPQIPIFTPRCFSLGVGALAARTDPVVSYQRPVSVLWPASNVFSTKGFEVREECEMIGLNQRSYPKTCMS